ncbi:MAG TPA: serine/threonine-protein kinase [Vicinamibacterales bacterium]|nr:serine/threonine-protein kinase [Vicinamibacterales bacterium]
MTWLSDAVVGRLREVATWPELNSDRYEIRRPVGRGGMGTVYAAYDTVLEREVAIKVSNALVPDDGLEERLRLEARVLARLEHPGIVPVHDAGVLDDGRLYYVMKLVHGETLAARAPALATEADRLAVFVRIAETVAFAQDSGVVHRDLQPANVMVGRFGEVLVLDWGVARLVDLIESPGIRVGTPGFMAPELQRGDSATAEPAADIFALGALLTWILGDAAVPRRLRAIADKCAQPDPHDRYANAADLVADLSRYRAGLPVSAHRDTLLERAGLWFTKYQTLVFLIAAYLLMRALLAFFQRIP